MFIKALLGTQTNKVKMTWVEYIFTHLIPTWFQSFNDNFRAKHLGMIDYGN